MLAATALPRLLRRLQGPNLAQTANQSNSNSVAATGGVVLQGQLVGQINANEQEGAAIAAASSDYVDIEQTDLLKRGGDGITGTSSAVAGANLNQTANQANSNNASATLEAPDANVLTGNGRTLYSAQRCRGAGATRWTAQHQRPGWLGNRRR